MATTIINGLWNEDALNCARCGKPEKECICNAPLEHALLAAPIVAYRIWRVQRQDTVTLDRATLARLAEKWAAGVNPFEGLVGSRLGALGVGVTWDAQTLDAKCHARTNVWTTSALAPVTFWNTSATVPVVQASDHASPDRHCGCGIWGLKNEADVWKTLVEYAQSPALEHAGFAYGVVQMWGRYYEHQHGYRCEHARPVEINVINGTPETVAELERFYECAVQSVPPPAESVALAAEKQKAVSNYTGILFQPLQQRGLLQSGFYQQQTYQNHLNALTQQMLFGYPPSQPRERTHGTPSTFLESSRRWTRRYEGRDTGTQRRAEGAWL